LSRGRGESRSLSIRPRRCHAKPRCPVQRPQAGVTQQRPPGCNGPAAARRHRAGTATPPRAADCGAGWLAWAAGHGAAAPTRTPCCKPVGSGRLICSLERGFPLAAESLTSKQLAKVMNFSAAAPRAAVNPFTSTPGNRRWWPAKTSGRDIPTLPAAPPGRGASDPAVHLSALPRQPTPRGPGSTEPRRRHACPSLLGTGAPLRSRAPRDQRRASGIGTVSPGSRSGSFNPPANRDRLRRAASGTPRTRRDVPAQAESEARGSSAPALRTQQTGQVCRR